MCVVHNTLLHVPIIIVCIGNIPSAIGTYVKNMHYLGYIICHPLGHSEKIFKRVILPSKKNVIIKKNKKSHQFVLNLLIN